MRALLAVVAQKQHRVVAARVAGAQLAAHFQAAAVGQLDCEQD